MSKPYQGNKPTYRIDKEKGKYAVRKFVEFDHSFAVYSKPLDTFDTIHGAKEYIRLLELEDEEAEPINKQGEIDIDEPAYNDGYWSGACNTLEKFEQNLLKELEEL